MKKILIPVALLLAATTAVVSCKKDDKAKSRHDMIVGTWKSYQSGVDSNGNGIWDANEKKTDTGSDIGTSVFNADGSGSVSGDFFGSPLNIPLTWNLQNNDNDFRVIISLFGSTDTSVVNIISLDDKTFVTKDPSASPVSFTSLNKQ